MTTHHQHLPEYIEALLTSRWEQAGREPDTTIATEMRKGTHWLVTPASTRPSIATFLKAVLRIQGWTQVDLSRRSGVHVCNLGRLVTGAQRSCAPETKSKFAKLVEGVPHLRDLFEATDWGLSAEPNRALAQEKKRRK